MTKSLEKSLAEFFDNATKAGHLSLDKFADALVELNPKEADHLFFYIKAALQDLEVCENEEFQRSQEDKSKADTLKLLDMKWRAK
tara:strand:- start:53 stop:307 length:255 start_codon:yes stop_codon:yes gene_type:complete